jgi:hypothetical protein
MPLLKGVWEVSPTPLSIFSLKNQNGKELVQLCGYSLLILVTMDDSIIVYRLSSIVGTGKQRLLTCTRA